MPDPLPTPPDTVPPAAPTKSKWWDRVLVAGTPLERGVIATAKRALALFADQTGRRVQFTFTVRDAKHLRQYLDTVEEAYMDRDRRLQQADEIFQDVLAELEAEHHRHRRAVEALRDLERTAAGVHRALEQAKRDLGTLHWLWGRRAALGDVIIELNKRVAILDGALEHVQGWPDAARPAALDPLPDPAPAAATAETGP